MPRNTLIQVRRDTSSNWTAVNPVLALGELGYETNTNKFKIGNGTSFWSALSYAAQLPNPDLQGIADATLNSAGYLITDGAGNFSTAPLLTTTYIDQIPLMQNYR